MPKVTRTCRVCGKQYEACRSIKQDVRAFHWQEVACSPECGAEYLRLVNEARNPPAKKKRTAESKAPVVEKMPAPATVEAEPSAAKHE